jgi:hypothetical protein
MSAQITISLENGEEISGGLRRFDPASSIIGRVDIMPESNVNTRAIELYVQWHTEGRGDRDMGSIPPIQLHSGQLNSGMPLYYPFNMMLPLEPWSYSGHYINIIWSVVVKIDIPRGKDVQGLMPFVLFPAAKSAQNESIF